MASLHVLRHDPVQLPAHLLDCHVSEFPKLLQQAIAKGELKDFPAQLRSLQILAKIIES